MASERPLAMGFSSSLRVGRRAPVGLPGVFQGVQSFWVGSPVDYDRWAFFGCLLSHSLQCGDPSDFRVSGGRFPSASGAKIGSSSKRNTYITYGR